MTTVVCIEAFGEHAPGDMVEMPDGSAWSELYYAEPGTPEAEAAQNFAGVPDPAGVPADSLPAAATPAAPSLSAPAAGADTPPPAAAVTDPSSNTEAS